MINLIKKLVMAFNSKSTIITNPVSSPPSPCELELEELEFLLKVLGEADLKGHQIEMFYKMVIKLQNAYIQKSK